MSKFIDALSATPLGTTMNGAPTHITSGDRNLDFFAQVGGLRKQDSSRIVEMFAGAFAEDRNLAVRNLIHARHVRAGLGERRIARLCIEHIIAVNDFNRFAIIMDKISDFGRWDDIIYILSRLVSNTGFYQFKNMHGLSDEQADALNLHRYKTHIVRILSMQIHNDKAKEKPSLLGKWLPSLTTPRKEYAETAKFLAYRWAGVKDLPKDAAPNVYKAYRRLCTELRNKINIVETHLTNNELSKVDYSAVPSKAILKYSSVFQRKDNLRFGEFINDVNSGDAKINTGTLTPFDVYRQMEKASAVDELNIQTIWDNLPKLDTDAQIMVMADTSGSMTSFNCEPWDVAASLAIYTSEQLKGPYNGKFIQFSTNPYYIDLSRVKGLRNKIRLYHKDSVVSCTNIEGALMLILNTAVKSKLDQSELPSMLLIISDMEFNSASSGSNQLDTIYNIVKARFVAAGYKMPTVAFWNVQSSQKNLPVRSDTADTMLISGYSPNILRSVLANDASTPMEHMIQTLSKPEFTVCDI